MINLTLNCYFSFINVERTNRTCRSRRRNSELDKNSSMTGMLLMLIVKKLINKFHLTRLIPLSIAFGFPEQSTTTSKSPITSAGFATSNPKFNFSMKPRRSADGSETVTRLNPLWWRIQVHKEPIIPAPWTRNRNPCCNSRPLESFLHPWTIHDSGSTNDKSSI